MQAKQKNGNVRVHARNIGGISQTDVTFEPGVTILAGRNATNRTSFLQAIMLALGSNHASLKGDAETGEVELEIGDERYTRSLTRQNGTISLDGDPYLDDPELVDLFAFLLEMNEARQAVARGNDLRELIMRPIDTDAIQAKIEQLEKRRQQIDDHLDEINREEDRLVELERRQNELESEIEDKRSELETAKTELESLDTDVEESREEKEALESKFDELREVRSELDQVRQQIEQENKSIDSLLDEQEEVEAELEDLPDKLDADTDEIESELERLRERRRNFTAVVSELQNIVQFNEEMLEDDRTDVRSALDQSRRADEAITDELLESKTTCWTCGSEVERDQIETTLDQLREFRQEKVDAIEETEQQLKGLKREQRMVEENRQEHADLESRLERIDDELETRRERIEEYLDERGELESQLEQLESEVDSLESEEFNEILDKHKEANQLEFELGQLQNNLENVEDDIDSIESLLEERTELQNERDEVQDSLIDARTKIDQIEANAVEEFNEHIETVLDLLDYQNLDRVWIERVEREVREGRRKVERSQFDLHIVRMNDEGKAYEDTVDHLSESEREVTGLVFALAGYLVHEVYETLPFIILDSLEAIDSDRIASLVEYFSDYADYSVVALLPEDETAFSETHQRVTSI